MTHSPTFSTQMWAPSKQCVMTNFFSPFTAPLGDLCRQHHTNFQSYADGPQNYLSFKPNSTDPLETAKDHWKHSKEKYANG